MGVFRFLWFGFLILGGWGGLKALEHGDPRGLVTFLFFVFLWKWRWVMEFIQDRRWRENWRYWS
jgi:hypothetical protein